MDDTKQPTGHKSDLTPRNAYAPQSAHDGEAVHNHPEYRKRGVVKGEYPYGRNQNGVFQTALNPEPILLDRKQTRKIQDVTLPDPPYKKNITVTQTQTDIEFDVEQVLYFVEKQRGLKPEGLTEDEEWPRKLEIGFEFPYYIIRSDVPRGVACLALYDDNDRLVFLRQKHVSTQTGSDVIKMWRSIAFDIPAGLLENLKTPCTFDLSIYKEEVPLPLPRIFYRGEKLVNTLQPALIDNNINDLVKFDMGNVASYLDISRDTFRTILNHYPEEDDQWTVVTEMELSFRPPESFDGVCWMDMRVKDLCGTVYHSAYAIGIKPAKNGKPGFEDFDMWWYGGLYPAMEVIIRFRAGEKNKE